MIEFNAEQALRVRPFLSVTAAVLVLFAGRMLNRHVAFLGKYNIPEPVTGGLLFSVMFGFVIISCPGSR